MRLVFSHSSESLKITPSEIKSLVFTDEVSDRITVDGLVLEQGSVYMDSNETSGSNIGDKVASSKRVRTAGTIDYDISIRCPAGISVMAVVTYDENGAFYSLEQPKTRVYHHVHQDGYVVRFVFSKYDQNENLSLNEMKATTMIDEKIAAFEKPKLIPYAKFDLDSGEESIV